MEFPLSDTIKKATAVLDNKNNNLFKVAEDFDLQMGGDGKGDALLQAIDHPSSPEHIIQMLCLWAEEPSLEGASPLTEHAFLTHSITLLTELTLSQDSVCTATSIPGKWFWKRLLQNHALAVDANFAESSVELAHMLAHLHLHTEHIIGE